MGKKEDLEIVDLELDDISSQAQEADDVDQKNEAYWEEQTGRETAPGYGRRPGRKASHGPAGREGPRGRDSGAGKGKKPGNLVGMILVCAGVVCLVAGGGLLVKNRIDAGRNQEQMETLRDQAEGNGSQQDSQQAGTDSVQKDVDEGGNTAGAQEPGQDPAAEAGSAAADALQATASAAGEKEPVRVPNPYAESYLQNEDMAAWLKIEDTKIDYPVMQTMEDENYYLKRGFDKKSNQNGCLILDTDSVLYPAPGTNLIIHGHNMKSGEMFGTLTKYEDKSYWEDHKYIQLYTKDCLRNYEVIAVFRSQVFKKTDQVFKFYKFFQADTQEEFDDWYQNIMALSEYDTGVTAEFGDKFLTLSTCVYHVENGRLVVVARETEPGQYYEPVE